MGLNHPRDLDAWHAWQRSRSPLRQLVDRFRPQPPLTGTLTVHGREPRVLVVLDWLAPTSLMAVFEMTTHLSAAYAVLSPAPLPNGWPGSPLSPRRRTSYPRSCRRWPWWSAPATTCLLARSPTRGRGAWERGSSRSQHGLLTPHAPPLAPDSTLLAWSAADADFWRSGRPDVQTQVVGSQLLWEASRGRTRVTDDRPTFLGQLHSAEMGRREMARFTGAFCRTEGTRYRPHPGERDRLSRWQHARWRRQGIELDDGSVPLRELPTPVVSVFSTGILEAAARGVPAWAAYDRPPAWLAEFWERYAMSRYGSDPTPAPAPPEREPAVAVAAAVEDLP